MGPYMPMPMPHIPISFPYIPIIPYAAQPPIYPQMAPNYHFYPQTKRQKTMMAAGHYWPK